MEKQRSYRGHVVVVAAPGQSHINPMIQLSRRLAWKGLKITLGVILSATQSIQTGNDSISLVSLYDDITQGGFKGPGGYKGFLDRFEDNATRVLVELVKNLENSEYPIKCLVYDANITWALDIAKQLGIASAAFAHLSLSAMATYYPLHLELSGEQPRLPPFMDPDDLPELGIPDLPSLGSGSGHHSPVLKLVLNPLRNFGKADWILSLSFDKLEEEVQNWMTNLCPVTTIGPTVPSAYLDKRIEDDTDYGFNLYKTNTDTCINWLNTKESRSVIYVSFGSFANAKPEQMKEMTEALKQISKNFLWVVKETELSNLPIDFVEETSEKGLVVTWCPQLQVLAHQAVGCFITHCGANSLFEAISFGVPMVGVPQFTDQMPNSYFMEKVWGAGLRPKLDDKGVASSKEIERSIREIFHEGRGMEIQKNVMKWKKFAKEAVDEGGSSDEHLNEFIAGILQQVKATKHPLIANADAIAACNGFGSCSLLNRLFHFFSTISFSFLFLWALSISVGL
ncbi:Glycosyltransferase [Quillaja saponaria]|uniref:Glycosyltransferase n=1 Tax=Quillaja saponaria TaxID=32244 RepID=A0AAD7M1B2_QUISA|nr:Glycosyltransferase [Quillaja saponaria]